jgi:hypothetical protein
MTLLRKEATEHAELLEQSSIKLSTAHLIQGTNA